MTNIKQDSLFQNTRVNLILIFCNCTSRTKTMLQAIIRVYTAIIPCSNMDLSKKMWTLKTKLSPCLVQLLGELSGL